jgi:hypothetical protein
MIFLNEEHKIRYKELMSRVNTWDGDVEREQLMYIIAGKIFIRKNR